jgi:hypothetical protein
MAWTTVRSRAQCQTSIVTVEKQGAGAGTVTQTTAASRDVPHQLVFAASAIRLGSCAT